jgi:hypothetical protein
LFGGQFTHLIFPQRLDEHDDDRRENHELKQSVVISKKMCVMIEHDFLLFKVKQRNRFPARDRAIRRDAIDKHDPEAAREIANAIAFAFVVELGEHDAHVSIRAL